MLFEGLDLNKYHKIQKPKNNILKDIPEEFCFLYTGHWLPGNLGEDRKNTGLMVKTFLETFSGTGNKKPALILKTNHVNYSILDKEEIIKKINLIRSTIPGKLPNIYVLHGEMTDEEMNQLNNDPKWSGHTDFIKPEYNILIGGELKKVDESAANQFLLKDSQWFNIDTNVASRAMKDVFKNYKKYWQGSRKQTQYIKDNWTFDKMVEKLSVF